MPSRHADPGSPRIGRVLAVFALLALVAAPVAAQVLYKWVDADGKTHYSDKLPAGFKGAATRIDLDAAPPPPALPAATPEPKPAPEIEAPKPASGIAARRKAVREALEARMKAAQAKLDAARKALEEGESVLEGERQVVQQRHPRREAGFFTKGSPAPRSNCMSRKDIDGKPIWLCPTVVPGEDYFERRKSLEEAVRLAEEELAAAELAYRRGVD